MSFKYEPSVKVLQALVKKPLYEENMLAKALRIWVILRTLYSEEPNSLNLSLPDSFSYADWHKAFFRQSDFHPNNDSRIQLEIHDPKCPCAYTITNWLFNNPDFPMDKSQWCDDFKSLRTGKTMDDEELKRLLHPEKKVTFKGVKQKKALLQQQYPQIKKETINLLFKKINQIVTTNKTVSEKYKSEIYQYFYRISQQSIDEIFQAYLDTKTERDTHRPMWGTRKNFTYMFDDIVNELGFLAKSKSQYYKLESLPKLLDDKNPNVIPQLSTEIIGNSIPNLIDWEELFQPINGQQRFFVDLENIVPNRISERVEELNEQLKEIWTRNPIPPVKLIYNSAKNFGEFECIVYPVCFYYIKRAPYLFAYGTTPQTKPKEEWYDYREINWYDYRVDRILKLEVLDWEDLEKWENQENILELMAKYRTNTLPTPNEIEEGIQSAFGYDFYKPQKPLILRFNKYFHGNYIEETERNNLFTTISWESVRSQIQYTLEQNVNSNINKELLLSHIETEEYQNSIYCQVNYYLDDNNVIMRLRSWSPNVEVILPWKLRQRMKEDIKKTWKLYESD